MPITYNGTSIDKVTFNGVEVFGNIKPLLKGSVDELVFSNARGTFKKENTDYYFSNAEVTFTIPTGYDAIVIYFKDKISFNGSEPLIDLTDLGTKQILMRTTKSNISWTSETVRNIGGKIGKTTSQLKLDCGNTSGYISEVYLIKF